MSKVPSHSSLGKTGPLITDAIGLTHAYVYTQYTHMDTMTHTCTFTVTQAYVFTLTQPDRTHDKVLQNWWITSCSYFEMHMHVL